MTPVPILEMLGLMEPTIIIEMKADELTIVLDALDAFEYWELGDRLPRNNGEVFIPGDLRPEDDRYWGPSPDPAEEQQQAIENVQRCRALAERLRSSIASG